MELNISDSMTALQYASKFIKLSKFIPGFMSSERLNMRRFEEHLAFYICNQQARPQLSTY